MGKARGYKDRDGYHRHQCEKCGWVWEHEDPHRSSKPVPEKVYAQRHLCPNCGVNERTRYHGILPPNPPIPVEKVSAGMA